MGSTKIDNHTHTIKSGAREILLQDPEENTAAVDPSKSCLRIFIDLKKEDPIAVIWTKWWIRDVLNHLVRI